MNGVIQMPTIVSSTDIRYRFKKIATAVNQSGVPAVVVDKSRPLVTITPYRSTDQTYSLQIKGRPEHAIEETRRKFAHLLKGWDATATIRQMRDTRWNLSSTPR